ncbi:hypothetical protein DITRI_Ditri10aG0028700 [Diplodiscus trichospermus]
MAQAEQLNSPEIKEPSPKVLKLSQNGVHEVTQGPVSLLRVKKLSEKAVLPSRGSPLAAGYDLSSATDTKVPARGKALIPIDLSIAIPEGTYGRVGIKSLTIFYLIFTLVQFDRLVESIKILGLFFWVQRRGLVWPGSIPLTWVQE